MNTAETQPRSSRLDHIFPQGVPGLWCHLPDHYTSQGHIDVARLTSHLSHLRKHIHGFVLSTSRIAPPEILNAVLAALKPGKDFLMLRVSNTGDAVRLPRDVHSHPCYAGCLLSLTDEYPDAIKPRIPLVLKEQTPAAFEMNATSPAELADMIAAAAKTHENLLYVSDATADHLLANHPLLPAGVFRLRSAEGNYTQALGSFGGRYHGLMLDSASVFPQQFAELVLAPALGKWDDARAISQRISEFFSEATRLEPSMPTLIVSIDHHMAYGNAAAKTPLPSLHDGSCVDMQLIQKTGDLLKEHDLAPEQGYL